MGQRIIVAVTTIVLFAFQPWTAAAATLLDQPPTQISGPFSDEGFDVFLDLFGYSQSVAENFQVITSDTGFLVEEVVVWGGFDPYYGSSFPLWDDVDVLIHADGGGLPGAVLCSQENVPATRVATGLTVAGFDEYMVTLALGAPCGLSDGNYWIEVYYNTTVGYDDWFWEWGDLDPISGLPGSAYAEENPGVSWYQISNYDQAVQINGTLGQVACVDTPAELQLALTAAGSSGADDVIQVVQGSYLTPGSTFSYTTAQNHDLQLLGGFTGDCSEREVFPANTTLDGGGANPVLSLQPDPSTSGRLHMQGFTIKSGLATGSATAGISVGGASGFGGLITIDHNAILDNQAVNGAAGIFAVADNGMLKLSNNLIAGNASTGGHGAGIVGCSGEAIWLTNNTVADNSCPACTGGLEVGGTVPPNISNNILWGNDGADLVFDNLSTWMRNNDIGSYIGTPDPGSVGNISMNPQFFGGGNYRLQSSSPAWNTGTNNPSGGLPEYDLDGRTRIQFGQVDMGAYEFPVVFYSGFEDPLLSDWSLVVGMDP